MPHENSSSSKTPPLRWLLRIVCVLVSLPVVLIVTLRLINMFDPPLDSAAVAAIDASPPPVPDAENSYFMFVGFGVAPTEDAHQYGMRIVAENNTRMYRQDGDFKQFIAENKAAQSLSWRGAKMICPEPRVNCLSIYVQKRDEIQALLKDNPMLLARYRSLYNYKYFGDTMVDRPAAGRSAEFPNYGGPEHETILAEIGIKAVDGHAEEALSDLAADTAFWRRVLTGASTSFPKSLATVFVDRNYDLLSEIVAQHRDDQHLIELAESMLTPLSPAERDWKRPFTHFFQMAADGYLNTLSDKSFINKIYILILDRSELGIDDHQTDQNVWNQRKFVFLTLFLYKPHATVNLVYRQLQNDLLAAAAPGNQFLDSMRRSVEVNTAMAPVPHGLGMIENYAGKLIAATDATQPDSYVKYVALTHNLEGRIRLVRMQLELYRQHIPAESIEVYLEKSPAELCDPYLLKPMHWDSTARELWFDGVDRKSERQIPELDHRISVQMTE